MEETLRTVLVDDEANARQLIRRKIEEHCPRLEIVGEAENVPGAVKKIHALKPDLVFLDVDMPGQNGFSLFEYFDEIDFLVIFVTASANHAREAFRVSALDYLMKPVNTDELQDAVQKVKDHHSGRFRERLELFEEQSHPDNGSNYHKLALSTRNSVEFVDRESIIYLEADGPYTKFHFENGSTVLVTNTLGDYDFLEKQGHFLKVHRSYIINLSKVKRFRKDESVIVMKDENEVSLSRYRKKTFLTAMGID